MSDERTLDQLVANLRGQVAEDRRGRLPSKLKETTR